MVYNISRFQLSTVSNMQRIGWKGDEQLLNLYCPGLEIVPHTG
jgi:hypothetical protein